MKKLLSVFLAALMIFSLVAVNVSAAEDEMKFVVATDIHYDTKNTYTPSSQETIYKHLSSSINLQIESGAIIDAFLENAASGEGDFVLIAGDLANNGTVTESAVVAAKLKAFEEESGKEVYVVPGNHDFIGGVSMEGFKAIYADLGYNQAVAVDTDSASYVAELSDDYRLLAIDNTSHGGSESKISDTTLAWIKSQVEKANNDGKKLIVMMHFALVTHSIVDVYKKAVSDSEAKLASYFAENGVKYVFSGHIHAHDVASYEASNGNTVYDIATGALVTYPCPYRNVTVTDERVKIETANVTSINTASLAAAGLTSDAVALAEADFSSYAKGALYFSLKNYFNSFLSSTSLISKLGVDKTEDAETYEILKQVLAKVKEAAFMPLYSAEGVTALEDYATDYGIEFEDSDYAEFADVLTELYICNLKGDENLNVSTTEIKLTTNAVAVILNYALSEYTAEEYAMVMSCIASSVNSAFGSTTAVNFLTYASDAVKRIEGCELLASSLVTGVLLTYTTDVAPVDSNVTLPGYGATQEQQQQHNFFEKVIMFFKNIYYFLLSLFAKLGLAG